MATLRVTKGYTFRNGVIPSIEDYNAAATPSVELDEGITRTDMADESIGPEQLADDVFSGLTEVSVFAADDSVPLYDLSGTVNGRVKGSTVARGVFSFGSRVTAFTNIGSDLITFYNGSDAVTMVMSRFIEQLLLQLTELTEPAGADGIVVVDASATAGSKARLVALENVINLMPNVGTPGSYANPTSITVDEKGRVTSVVTSGAGKTYSTADAHMVALPASAGAAGAVSLPHGLSAKPRWATVSFVCTDAAGDAGYAQNDERDARFFVFDDTGPDYISSFVVGWDATNIVVTRPDSVGVRVPHKTTGVLTAPDLSKWKVRGFAIQ